MQKIVNLSIDYHMFKMDSEEEIVWKNLTITSVIICLTEDKQSDKDLLRKI